ncbi:hypothetical protein K7H08_09520 [Halomonas sp. IOP_6]|uniref:hypothetical protein n=1 Tax=Halomonas sp. IOP_6 TaxID=2876583 RepID=UPI001E429F4D|nr:hypothetical protein [Halomonas sp. IOP_6]MCD6005069.1 hypothetical protein [Halomonas sp. IOP_6]
MSEEHKRSQVTEQKNSIPTEIHLGPNTSLDLSWLSEEERKQLMIEHTKGMLDLGRKSQELHVDSGALKRTLDDLSSTSREASEDGNSVTISHTQTTSIGRTEVLMGNTEKAQKGRLTKSQTGEKDWTPYYIAGAVVLVIVVAMITGG